MKLQRLLAAGDVQPAKLFLTVLVLIFGVEATVMVVMPWLFPGDQNKLSYALIDSCLLTGVLAPLLWWLVIVPLRFLAATRLRLLDHILDVQEDERGRIARELHDSLGQLLTCLQVGLRAAEESTTDKSQQHRLQELRSIGSETHREIRRIASGLRPIVLDDVGLMAALERHCDDLNHAQTVQARFSFEGPSDFRLPRSVETACYRIAQEATTNALLHGHATQVTIELQIESSTLQLRVRDNGTGFDPKTTVDRQGRLKHIGLWSIQERVALLAGSMTLESAPGAGTTVTVTLPIAQQDAAHGEDSRTDR